MDIRRIEVLDEAMAAVLRRKTPAQHLAIGFGRTPFDRSRFVRTRVLRPAESYEAAFASAEDVVIKKMGRQDELWRLRRKNRIHFPGLSARNPPTGRPA